MEGYLEVDFAVDVEFPGKTHATWFAWTRQLIEEGTQHRARYRLLQEKK